MLGYELNIPKLEARQMLDDHKAGRVELTPDALHDVIMLASGDRKLADRAHFDLSLAIQKRASPA